MLDKKEYQHNWFKNLSREEKDKRNRKTNEYRNNKYKTDKAYREKVNSQSRAWSKNNRESRNTSQRKIRLNRRKKLISILGDICADCGISDFEVLQLGHRNDDGKKDRERFLGSDGKYKSDYMCFYYIKHPQEAKEKLKLQCANCNWKQRFKNSSIGKVNIE